MTGKALPLNTEIPTPDGIKLMGDLSVNDEIFNSNGNVCIVTNIFPQGSKEMYRMVFSDGRVSICCKEHLWKVIVNDEEKIMTAQEIHDDFPNNRYKIPALKEPVKYNKQETELHPYVLGAKYAMRYLEYEPYSNPNVIQNIEDILKELKGTPAGEEPNYDKYIDENRMNFFEYIYNEEKIRSPFLKGVIDVGSLLDTQDKNYILKITANEEEDDAATFILRMRLITLSLGYYDCIYNGNILIIFDHPTIHALRTGIRKYYSENPLEFDLDYLNINIIEPYGSQECQCITVNSSDELFLTEDFIVTHNTFMACYLAIKSGLRTLIIAPTSGIKKQWAETLTDMFNVDPSKVKLVNKPNDFIKVKEDFVVVSQASLSVLNKTYDLEKIMKDNKFGFKVIDEVQMWFHNIIKVDACSNIANNLYLTGTFGRSGDRENEIYQEMFGDLKIFREKDKKATIFNRKPGNIYGMKPHMNIKMIWTRSGLTKEEIKKVTNSMRYSEREQKWMRYGISIPAYTDLIIPPDGSMTRYLKTVLDVVDMALKEVNYGRTLVLGSTIASCEIVASYIRKKYPNLKIGTYHSRNDKVTNDKSKNESDILVSTISSAGTGFDMKDLSRLITFSAWKSWILSDQISGRLRRRPDEKETFMWDIVDSEIKQLRAWANNRAEVYKRKSKSFKVVEM